MSSISTSMSMTTMMPLVVATTGTTAAVATN
jgi:hypothetical protein